jgi:hypothetical protein
MALEEIHGFLCRQKNISAKNITRLRELLDFPSHDVAAFARMVLQVAEIAPRRRHRVRNLQARDPVLLRQVAEVDYSIEIDYSDAESLVDVEFESLYEPSDMTEPIDRFYDRYDRVRTG